MESEETYIMKETLESFLAVKHPKFPLFYVGGVRQNTYFHSRGYFGGCGLIGRAKTFGEFGPQRYVIEIPIGVAFKIRG